MLTGTQVMLLVASETGHVYTFATKKLQPMITSETGKNLIRDCLSPTENSNEKVMTDNNEIEIENQEFYENVDFHHKNDEINSTVRICFGFIFDNLLE